MKFLLFLICSVLMYIILSLFIGIIGGFGVWNFLLLKELIMFWITPTTISGAFWKSFILLISIISSVCSTFEPFKSFESYPVPTKVYHEDFTISEPNQCVVKKDEHVDISV